MTTHVAIATTKGPAFVQGLTEEDPGVSPTVCLNGSSKQLAITNAYAEFVRKGSGLIERDFGIASWRVDLSEPVDSGDSWQLGLYTAHSLYANGRLGDGQVQSGDEILLTTGAVLHAGDVRPVEHIIQKMQSARDSVSQWQAAGAKVSLLMHPDNLEAALASLAAVNEQHAISHIQELQTPSLSSTQKKWRSNNILITAFVVITMVSLYAANHWRSAPAGSVLNPNHQTMKGDDSLGFDHADSELIASAPNEGVSEQPTIADSIADKKLLEPKTDLLPGTAYLTISESAEPFLCFTKEMTTRVEAANSSGHFPPTSLRNLCSLFLHQGVEEYRYASLFALDSGAMRELASSHQQSAAGWEIPLPGNTNSDRPYALVLTGKPMDNEYKRQLIQNRNNLLNGGIDPRSALVSAMTRLDPDSRIYVHSLTRH